MVVLYASISVLNLMRAATGSQCNEMKRRDLKQYRKPSSTRGYWKFNNCLLEDASFNDYVTHLAKTMFSQIEGDACSSWEFFKFNVRDFAVDRSKQIKREKKNNEEFELIHRLGVLMQKNNPSKEDEVEYSVCQMKIENMYTEIFKGAKISISKID